MKKKEKPYIEKKQVVVTRHYNPKFGNDKPCGCGHSYYRHFDSYDNMFPCGCKYCDCTTWHEQNETPTDEDLKNQRYQTE